MINECSIEECFNYKCNFNNTIEIKQKIINKIKEELFRGSLNQLINKYYNWLKRRFIGRTEWYNISNNFNRKPEE